MLSTLRSSWRPVSAFALVCALNLAWVHDAQAEVKPYEDAQSTVKPYDSLVERGRAALESGDYSVALRRFMVALEMVDGGDAESWRMLLAIAVTYDQMGQLGHAAEFHRKFLMRAQQHAEFLSPAWAKRVEVAKRDVDRIMKKAATTHGFLSVVSQPPGASISVDGRPVGAMGDGQTPFLLFLEPGVHHIRLSRPGYIDEAREIRIAATAIRALDVVLTQGSARGVRPIEPVEELPTSEPTSEPTPLGGSEAGGEAAGAPERPSALGPWLTLASGGVGLALGALFTAMAASEHSALMDERAAWTSEVSGAAEVNSGQRAEASLSWDAREERQRAYEASAIGLYAAGAALLGGGVLWLLLRDDDPQNVGVWSLMATPDGVYGQAMVRF